MLTVFAILVSMLTVADKHLTKRIVQLRLVSQTLVMALHEKSGD